MGQVIDFGVWRKARLGAQESPPFAERASAAGDLDELERAVQRLHPLVSSALGEERQLGTKVETELLAIIGELTMGLVQEATRRAERLAERLAVGWGGPQA
jgi:hypothetical protein